MAFVEPFESSGRAIGLVDVVSVDFQSRDEHATHIILVFDDKNPGRAGGLGRIHSVSIGEEL
jgi:hypothetical protein